MHRISLSLAAVSVLVLATACGPGSHRGQAPANTQVPTNQRMVLLPGRNEISSIAMLPADGVISSLPVLVSFMAEDGMVPRLKPTGLSGPEPWGTWSAAKEVSLQFTFADPPPPSATITLSFHALAAEGHPQSLEFLWNGLDLGGRTCTDFKDLSLSYDLSGLLRPNDTLTIEVPDAASPKSLGISQDSRELGIALVSIVFAPK